MDEAARRGGELQRPPHDLAGIDRRVDRRSLRPSARRRSAGWPLVEEQHVEGFPGPTPKRGLQVRVDRDPRVEKTALADRGFQQAKDLQPGARSILSIWRSSPLGGF